MEATLKEDQKRERIQLQVPSELIRTKEMSRKLMGLYNEWVEAGRPLRDGGDGDAVNR